MNNRHILTPFYIGEALPELETLAAPGWLLNRPELPMADKQTRMSVLHRSLADRVADTLDAGERPLSVAGDCCSAIAVLAGLQRAGLDPMLIWLDAHGDFNTWETTPSGFLGGMPLAMLVGRGEQRMPEEVGLRSLPENQVVLCDGRDLDPGEKLALQNSAVYHLRTASELLNFSFPERPLYIHFDTDIIDPQDAPAMNYLAPGGPSAAEMNTVFSYLADTGRVIAISVSSWNPLLDPDGHTQHVCMQLVEILAR